MREKVAKVCVTQHDNKTEFRAGLFYSFYIHLMQRVFKYNASDDSFFPEVTEKDHSKRNSDFFWYN